MTDTFIHSNGFSTERNIATAVMRRLGLDETDFRKRDELIMRVISPWTDAERLGRGEGKMTTEDQSKIAAALVRLMESITELLVEATKKIQSER